MIHWWLRGAALLAILSVLPSREREKVVCLIGRWCLGLGLVCMVGLPVGSVINTLVPGGLPLSVGFVVANLYAIALPMVTAGLAIMLGRTARWSWDALVPRATAREPNPAPKP